MKSTHDAPEMQPEGLPSEIMVNTEDLGWVRMELVRINPTGRFYEWMYVMPGSLCYGIYPETAAEYYHMSPPRVRPVPAEDPDPIIDHAEAVYLARRVREEKGFSDPERYGWAGEILEHDVFSFKELTRSEADRIRAELATADARLYTLPSFTRTAPRQRVAL